MKLVTTFLILLFLSQLCREAADAQIHFDDFTSLDGITMVGDAAARGNVLMLTPAQQGASGAIWISRMQFMEKGFITRFTFRIRDTAGQPDVEGRNGGDGIAFVIHNTQAGSGAIGGIGGNIGYGQIGAGLAVEFDTYNNSDPRFGDPSGNHISVQTGSAKHSNSWGTDLQIPNLSDGRIHTATIEYYRGTLSVYLDNCAPVRIAVDMALEPLAWVGLTSSTGAAWESHEILSWQFNPLGAERTFIGQPCDAEGVILSVRGDFSSYRWSTGETTRSITVRRSGTYTVQVADTNGCSSLIYQWDEKVDLGATVTPVITASGSTNICEGDSVTLTSDGDFARYAWSPTGGGGRSMVARTAGRYFVTAYDSRGCASISNAIDVTIRPRPTVSITASGPLVFCEEGSVTLTAEAGLATYLWSNGERTRSIVVRQSGSYSVTGTAANGCTATAEAVDVRVDPAPRPKITIEGPKLCQNDSLVLDAGDGFAFYLWSSGETTRKIVTRGPGTWSVVVRSFGGCNDTSQPITILPGGVVPPTILVTGALPFCIGDSVTLSVEQTYRSYLWNDGSTARGLTVGKGGVYQVRVIDSAGCTASDTIDLQEPIPPPVVKILPSGALMICDGDSLVLNTAPTTAPLLWSTGSTSSRIVVTLPGTYRVTAGTGRCSSSDSVTVVSAPRPDASAGSDQVICAGEVVRLEASGGTTYLWSPSSGLECVDCASPLASPASTTRYIVEVGNGGICTGFDTVVVTVTSAGKVDAGPDRMLCRGDSIVLNASGATGYSWSPSTGLSCSDCSNPVAAPLLTTEYIISPVGVGTCLAPDTVMIIVADEGVMFDTRIDRGIAGAPGEQVTARLLLDGTADAARIDSLDLVIDYNPHVALPDTAMTGIFLTDGTLLENWNVTLDLSTRGRIVAHLGSADATTLAGAGTLLQLPFLLFIGDSSGTELTYKIITHGARCVSQVTRPGRLQVDSICGLSYRLIEVGNVKYALGELTPNPSSTNAEISFALGLDAPTTIQLFDLNGNEVGRPIDETMVPGGYRLQIETASLPAGVYLLRLESGPFVQTRRMVVRR